MKVQEIKLSAIAHGSIVTFSGLELKGLTKVGSHKGAVTARLEALAAKGEEDAEPLMYHNYSLGGRVFTVDSRRQADVDLLDKFVGAEPLAQGEAKPKIAEVQLIANDYQRRKRNELGVETDEMETASSWRLDYVVTHADAIAAVNDERELNKARGIVGGAIAAPSASELASLRADIAALMATVKAPVAAAAPVLAEN